MLYATSFYAANYARLNELLVVWNWKEFFVCLTFFVSIFRRGSRCCRCSRRWRRRQRRGREFWRVGGGRWWSLHDRRAFLILNLAFWGRTGGHESVEALWDGRRTEIKMFAIGSVNLKRIFVGGLAITRRLSTTPQPTNRAVISWYFLLHYSMICVVASPF